MGALHPFDVREDLASQGPFAVSEADSDMARALVGVLGVQDLLHMRQDRRGGGVPSQLLKDEVDKLRCRCRLALPQVL